MIRAFTLGLCSSTMLLMIACTKGRYTEDRHYVGNPERPQATSESTMGDNKARNPSDTELHKGEIEMTRHTNTLVMLMGLMVALVGCNRYEIIPNQLEPQVRKNVAFSDIEQSPSTHKGQLVILGGEVLSTKRLADKTQIEVLQLPLTEECIPITEDRTRSQGRVLRL